jgi:hypothetical protein
MVNGIRGRAQELRGVIFENTAACGFDVHVL